jgi:hypothetical protein
VRGTFEKAETTYQSALRFHQVATLDQPVIPSNQGGIAIKDIDVGETRR